VLNLAGNHEGKAGNEEFDLIAWRRAMVLELHSQGLTERAIADKLKVGKSTIHDDIVALRAEAKKQVETYIENVPYAWEQCRTTVNLLLKKAWEMADRKGLEFDQELDIIKAINDLNESRLNLYGDLAMLEKSVKHTEGLKKQIADLKGKANKPAPNDVEVIHETGTTNIKRTGIKKGKQETFRAVV
jgi:hypothetical protein